MNYQTINKIGVILLLICTKDLVAQYKLEKLGSDINTDIYDEISPVITRNGRTLYFTRLGTHDFSRTLIQDDIDLSKTLTEPEYFTTLQDIYSQIAQSVVTDPVTSPINQEIWVADSRQGIFDRVFHPGFPLNTALPNSVCSLAPNDDQIITINHFAKDGSMFKGFSFTERKPNGSFGFPSPIYVQDFHSKSPDVNICMSRDGDVIILSLDRQEGLGDADLYVSFKLKDNLWSVPANMGPVVNSRDRDITPFLSEDKSRLFFASNRPGGLGGTDIYMTRRLDYTWTKWTKPQPLSAPINSVSDDSNPIYVEPNAFVYFISRRDGSSDIFRVDLNPTTELETPIVLRGTIRHSVTNEPIAADLYYGPSRLATSDLNVHVTQGAFEITIYKRDLYRLAPKKFGFIGKNQMVDAAILAQTRELIYEIDFYMTPILQEQKLEVNSIYFEKGTYSVRSDSYAELDRLATMLTEHPMIHIRIVGHTDSVGVSYELLDLSRSRSEAIKKYMVTVKGIGSNRITTEGYGSSMPIAPNLTEDDRAKNRRVEIFISNPQTQKTIEHKDLLNPSVRISKQQPPAIDTIHKTKKTPGTVPSSSHDASPDSAGSRIHYGNLGFVSNELSIKEASIPHMKRLVDYLAAHTSKKITLIGMTDHTEKVVDMQSHALQRAQGVKEYLVYKSIPSDRIQIMEIAGQGNFSGVKVFVEK